LVKQLKKSDVLMIQNLLKRKNWLREWIIDSSIIVLERKA
jgi:hypothetical protein